MKGAGSSEKATTSLRSRSRERSRTPTGKGHLQKDRNRHADEGCTREEIKFNITENVKARANDTVVELATRIGYTERYELEELGRIFSAELERLGMDLERLSPLQPEQEPPQ